MHQRRHRGPRVARPLCVALFVSALVQAQQWQLLPPPKARSLPAMVFDSLRGHTLLFGGDTIDRLANDTWMHDGSQWSHVPTPTSPLARRQHAMAFDAVRGVAVLFGGMAGSQFMNDTWEFDGTTWSQVTTATTPSGRWGHAMAHHPPQGVLLFGGGDRYGLLGDTWVYDGVAWTPVTGSPATPSSRARHAMAHDSMRGVTVLFGGTDSAGSLDDTWEYSNGAWLQKTTPSNPPSARVHPGMAYHAGLGQTVLFGGLDASGVCSDTWHYDGNDWALASPASAPVGRREAALVHDSVRGVCVLFGGLVADASKRNDTWVYDGTNWTEDQPLSPAPTSRRAPGMVHDPMTRRLLLFGGETGEGTPASMNDLWELEGDRWTEVLWTSRLPAARAWHGMAHDQSRGVSVVYGGVLRIGSTTVGLHDTWEYDSLLRAWTPVPTTTAPGASLVSMCYDPERRVVLLFGGQGNSLLSTVFYDETWEYDGQTQQWTRILPVSKPSARHVGAMAYDARRGRVVLFGGGRLAGTTWTLWNDTWEYDASVPTWVRVQTAHAPPPRIRNALVDDPDRGRIVLFGGSGQGPYGLAEWNDTWEYDGTDWSQVAISAPPTASQSVGMAFDMERHRLVRYGGGDYNPTSDTWRYVPAAQATWTSYGAGCPGSNGTPNLAAASSSVPALGATFLLDVVNLPPAAGLLFATHSFDLCQYSGQPLPLALGCMGRPGCALWIAPMQWYAGTYVGSTATIPIIVPNQPALAGIRFASQVLTLDIASPFGLDAVSNAGIGTVY